MQQTATEYPFITRHSPNVILGKGEGYAETYPIGETGKPLGNNTFSRPQSLPIDKLGIEIYQPERFTSRDLAGEVLHGDPVANKAREELLASLTPKQLEKLKFHALDYEESKKQGMPENLALRNLGDAALRGYVLNQFPDKVNKDIGYNPQQQKLFNNLLQYMKTPMQQEQVVSPMYTDPFGNSI
jgi:hypothetical protein